MDDRSYTDFDLVIERAGDRYRARVIGSPAGQAAVEFDPLFSPLELENFVLRMGRPKRGMRRIDSPEMETVKTFGTRLFRAVFKDEVYACYLRSLDEALDQNQGLRVRLRIDVPEFHDLPWEYLYNPQVDQFLALSKDTPVIRYIELPYKTQAQPVRAPVKILAMISSPGDYPPLDVEEEWRRLSRALEPLVEHGQVILQRLERPTLGALQRHLRREQVHVFHFIGHGKYFEREQDGMLLLEDENRRGMATSGQQLGAILHDHHSLRLVVLNACEGARTSAQDPYTGVAQTLVRQGLPAVLAMQFEIFENAAVTLAQEFYGAIADGYPVDAALSEARKAIFASNNDVEWGTPVLFMRIPNGVLFKPQTQAEKAARQRAAEKAARERAEGIEKEREALQEKESAARLEQARKEEARAEQAVLEKAEREAEENRARLSKLNRWYAEAQDHLDLKDWEGAVEALERIWRLEPTYRDSAALLEEARSEIKRAGQEAEERKAQEERLAELDGLYRQAKRLMDRQDWAGAVATLEKIVSLNPADRDAAAMMEQAQAGQVLAEQAARERAEREAREKRAREQREAERDQLYDEAKHRLEKGDLQDALQTLQRVLALAPEHGESQKLLAETNDRIEQEREAQSRRMFLDGVYEVAEAKMTQKDWAGAIDSLEMLEQSEPGFRDAKSLLEQARLELVRQAKESQSKQITEPEKPVSDASKPASLPEQIKPRSKPTNLPR